MEPPTKRLRPDQRICPHCSEIVSYKTFRCHRRLHYNRDTGVWFTNATEKVQEVESPRLDDIESLNGDKSESSPPSTPTYDESIGFLNSDESPPHSDAAVLSDSDVSVQSEPGE